MFASAPNFSLTHFTRTLAGAAGTLLFAGLCIAGATAPANAQIKYGVSDSGRRIAEVSYADLDLGSPAGRETLNARLRIASKNVCKDASGKRWDFAEEVRCYHETLQATRNVTMAAIKADKLAS